MGQNLVSEASSRRRRGAVREQQTHGDADGLVETAVEKARVSRETIFAFVTQSLEMFDDHAFTESVLEVARVGGPHDVEHAIESKQRDIFIRLGASDDALDSLRTVASQYPNDKQLMNALRALAAREMDLHSAARKATRASKSRGGSSLAKRD